VVIVAANLSPQKNHGLLVAAATQLIREGLPLRVWLAGDGPMRDAIEARVLADGVEDRVSLLGRRADVPALLAGSDIAALTSVSQVETFPMCILEAMAAGLPVVATAVGGIPEMVAHGVTGELVASQDFEALTAVLRRMVTTPTIRAEYGRLGRERVSELFTRERMIGAYADLFSEIDREFAGTHGS
jgi:glycosyltransferase involved in cell wall biosynthesis